MLANIARLALFANVTRYVVVKVLQECSIPSIFPLSDGIRSPWTLQALSPYRAKETGT